MVWLVLSSCSLLIWLYIVCGRGDYWRVSRNIIKHGKLIDTGRRVTIVIPARNEVETIGDTLDALFLQSLQMPPHIVLVDDGSEDGTAERARRLAESRSRTPQLTVIEGRPLPAGWTGKLWALSQGFDYAQQFGPDYILLTDADITHGKDSLLRLVELAERENRDMVSCMAKLACVTWPERALIPAFVFFFLQLYPPAWVNSAKRRTAGAAGGCVLLRPLALTQAGGLQAIRGAVIDDCALARLLKRNGSSIWLGLTEEVSSTRSYGTLGEIGNMISRTAFSQLRHSMLLLVGTVVGLLITYVIPLLALTQGTMCASIGLLAMLLMACSYLPTIQFYKQPTVTVLLLPFVAIFYAGSTIDSAFKYLSGRGGAWKGRIQDGG